MKKSGFALLFLFPMCLMFCGCAMGPHAEMHRLLAGTWRFSLDRQDAGIAARWFGRQLPDRIHLPGSLQEQGYGDIPSAQTSWISGIGFKLLSRAKYARYQRPGHFETPFWLTPDRHYVGAAWYQREIDIPENWRGKRIILHLERAHWQTSVWLDDRPLGTRDSLGTPDDFDLTATATPGRHRLTVRVDNRIRVPVGLDASSVTDQTQTDWNGIIGDISLRATNPIWIDNVQVYPDVKQRRIRVQARIGNDTQLRGRGELTASVTQLSRAGSRSHDESVLAPMQIPVQFDAKGGSVEFQYKLGADAKCWDEFSPDLYRLTLNLNAGGQPDCSNTVFGLRDISTRGTQFILNGHPIMLRGTLECCIFPLTGYPPTDLGSWERILRIAKAHGLNHMRFHSWCPPEAAFEAADRIGFYFSVECSCWAKQFGENQLLDSWVSAEAQRMLRQYGNHPSFILMVPSNEPDRKDYKHFLANLIRDWQKQDSRRLYTAGSGWPKTPANQYDVESATRLHNSGELKHRPQTASDYRDYVDSQPVPSVVHEMGQWCVYPDFDEIPKYTGSLKPGNLEIFRDLLKRSGMSAQFHDFFIASGKFQTQLYKAEIEEVLRTPGIGGFQLLDLHDFPGQGTAPIGVLDAFWDAKPYVDAAEYRRFCDQTVVLARLKKRVFLQNEKTRIEIDVSNFGPRDLSRARLSWQLRDTKGKTLQQGTLTAQKIKTGTLSTIGFIDLAFDHFPAPGEINLEVSIDKTRFANDWNFWVYPTHVDTSAPDGIVISHKLDDTTAAKLIAGAKILLLPGPAHIAGQTYGAFEPIFWNRITFPNQAIHTLGILCDPKTPALAEFPTNTYSNWQWWDLQQHSKPMILDGLPKKLTPIVQMIDDWDECRKLGLVVQTRVGKGKLIVCSIDLSTDLADRPVARQMRRSLLQYMASDAFSPKIAVTVPQIRQLLR